MISQLIQIYLTIRFHNLLEGTTTESILARIARNTQFLSTSFTTGAYTNTSDRSATV